jgi:hypothetical protein
LATLLLTFQNRFALSSFGWERRNRRSARDHGPLGHDLRTPALALNRPLIFPCRPLAEPLIRLGLPPALRTATLTCVRKDCLRGLTRAPRLHDRPDRRVGQWPPNRPCARRKQCSISDVDDNRTALIAPSTARFTDPGMSFSLPNFIQ